MAVAPIVEDTVKYREGRKWKERWCVLKKPSPVADCLIVMLYKDNHKQALKSSLTLDEYCGIDTNSLDGEKHTLSIICCNKSVSLAFTTAECREQWRHKLLLNFGEDICFKVELAHGLPEQKFSGLNMISNNSNLCNLFLTSSRMSLTTTENSNFLLKHLYSWRYVDLKKCGFLEANLYGIQVSFKEGKKNFVFRTYQSAEIDKALKTKVQSLVQSCGLFKQLLYSVSATNSSPFSTSASNPSTPTFCVSSNSSKAPCNVDRRFSSPHSQLPPKDHAFSNSVENTVQHPGCSHQFTNSRNGSFAGCFGFSEQQSNHLVRHHSECNLHISQMPHKTANKNLNSTIFVEKSSNWINIQDTDGRMTKANYVNYDTNKLLNESLLHHLNDKEKVVYSLPPRGSSHVKAFVNNDKENFQHAQSVKEASSNEEFFFNGIHTNMAMMNGGFCANSSVAFDPLQPLPYRDLSRYDGESDEGYLYWLPGSPRDSKKSSLLYVNFSTLETKQSKSCPMKLRTKRNIGEYLKPNLSTDSLNLGGFESDSFHVSTSNLEKNSYINVSGIYETEEGIVAHKSDSEDDKEEATQRLALLDQTYASDYVPINHLSSDTNDFYFIDSGTLQRRPDLFQDKSGMDEPIIVNDYLDMSGSCSKLMEDKINYEDSSLDIILEKNCVEHPGVEINEEERKYSKGNDNIQLPNMKNRENSTLHRSDALCSENFSYEKPTLCKNVSVISSDVEADLLKKIYLSPPPPISSNVSSDFTIQSQEYINLSSVTISEPLTCLSPPPRPPKILNCIKEDVSESCALPPPLPGKVRHSRGSMDQDCIHHLPVPVRRKDHSSNVYDSCPKPPLPRRSCQSSVNLHSSPPPGISTPLPPHAGPGSLHNRCSTLSSSGLPKDFSVVRPVSASSASRHRKPNLTVDIKNVNENEQSNSLRTSDIHGSFFYHRSGKGNNTPISVTGKQNFDDLNRSMPALATSKPRNGREYVDRRRLAEENSAPSLPPYSAQRSPSVASTVFTFDDRSVASAALYNCYSSGEDSPKYPLNVISSARSSLRYSFDQQKRSFGCYHHRDMSCNGSPGSCRLESPRTFSTSTMDSIETVINYADIDVLPGEFCTDQSKMKFVGAASPHLMDNKTVYAKIDVSATSAASKVGKQHAKQREDTLEKRVESSTLNKLQHCEVGVQGSGACPDKRKLSLELRKQSSISIRD